MGRRDKVRARAKRAKQPSGRAGPSHRAKPFDKKPEKNRAIGRERERGEERGGERKDSSSLSSSLSVRYKPTMRILVVGDGDFAFSKGLTIHVGGAAAAKVSGEMKAGGNGEG